MSSSLRTGLDRSPKLKSIFQKGRKTAMRLRSNFFTQSSLSSFSTSQVPTVVFSRGRVALASYFFLASFIWAYGPAPAPLSSRKAYEVFFVTVRAKRTKEAACLHPQSRLRTYSGGVGFIARNVCVEERGGGNESTRGNY